MKNINWKVRFKNPHFWLTIIPMLLLLGEQVAFLFGHEWNVDNEAILAALRTLLAILAGIGIIEDFTTEGLGDSNQALKYKEPRKDGKPW